MYPFAGLDLNGRLVVSNIAGAGTCVVEETAGNALTGGTAAAGAIVSIAVDAGVTPAELAVGEGLQIDVTAGATCTVTLFIDST